MSHYINLDNASTSFPKAPGVAKAVYDFLNEGAYNVGRGHYKGADENGLTVLNCRRKLAEFFDVPAFRNIAFTASVTYALNFVIKGFFKAGDHIVTSSMEHNAVMRPLHQVASEGVSFTAVNCARDGSLDPQALEEAIRPETKAVIITAASNVCGTVMPLQEISEICRRRGLYFILDSAQMAGVMPISMRDLGLSALCITGHKGLLGPQGIGALILSDELVAASTPLITGGTGSFSDSEEVPLLMPDRFEAGTQNLPGIIGLSAAIDYLRQQAPDAIYRHEIELSERFLSGIAGHPEIRVCGKKLGEFDLNHRSRLAVLSLDFPNRDNAEISARLNTEHGIMTRCGLHCAPRAHQTLGTFPQGTVRFSVGPFNTLEEIDVATEALIQVLK